MPVDTVKQWLEELKESACAANEIAMNYVAGMGLRSVTPIVQLSVLVAKTKAETLLNPDKEPSFNPPDAGSNYTPIGIPDPNLVKYASTLKEEACEALEKYCNGDTDGAAKHVRRLVGIFAPYESAIGTT